MSQERALHEGRAQVTKHTQGIHQPQLWGSEQDSQPRALWRAKFWLLGLQVEPGGPLAGPEQGGSPGTAPASVGAWPPEAPGDKEVLSKSEKSRILCTYLLPSWQFPNALSVGNSFPDTEMNQKPVQKRMMWVPHITIYISFLRFYIQINKNLSSTASLRDTTPGAAGARGS